MDALVGDSVIGALTEVPLERKVSRDLALELGADGDAHAERILHLLLGGHDSGTEGEEGEDGTGGEKSRAR